MKIESRSRLLLNRKRIGRRTPIAHTAVGSNLTWRKKKAWTWSAAGRRSQARGPRLQGNPEAAAKAGTNRKSSLDAVDGKDRRTEEGGDESEPCLKESWRGGEPKQKDRDRVVARGRVVSDISTRVPARRPPLTSLWLSHCFSFSDTAAVSVAFFLRFLSVLSLYSKVLEFRLWPIASTSIVLLIYQFRCLIWSVSVASCVIKVNYWPAAHVFFICGVLFHLFWKNWPFYGVYKLTLFIDIIYYIYASLFIVHGNLEAQSRST